MATLKSFLLNLFFPIHCLGCGREGFWLCERCLNDLRPQDEQKIQRQKNNLVIPYLDGVFIAGDYDDPLLATAIKKFKYNFIAELGKILGRFLTLYWSGQKNFGKPLAVPIPLSKKRWRWRGFNQAEILAREFSANFNYDLSLELKRVKHQKPQAELSEAERLNNIQGVFAWTGADLSGRVIILIDDVVTTGATLNEAARILKAAGADKIYGLVLAKG